jgi:aryl-alcohol dehydrogenase-like predicted oxidoreductase
MRRSRFQQVRAKHVSKWCDRTPSEFTANLNRSKTISDLGTKKLDPSLFSEQKHAAPAQVALACLLTQNPWIVPIPGTTRLQRLEENIGSTRVELTASDLQKLDRATANITVEGDRYPEELERMTNR